MGTAILQVTATTRNSDGHLIQDGKRPAQRRKGPNGKLSDAASTGAAQTEREALRVAAGGMPRTMITLGSQPRAPVPPSTLKRPLNPMPAFVELALLERGLMEAYRRRPPYQRNDYLGWIERAKRETTKLRRLAQMLDELEQGDRYMKMAWRPSTRGC